MKKLILLFMIMISISFISCEDAKESDDKTVQQNEGKENGTESGVDNDANPDNDDSGENGTNSNNNPAEDPIENPTENPVEIVIENPSLLKKPRIVVMADIMPLPPEGEEPKHEVDDVQSFIRLLVYSNEFEIIGLIGANSRYGVNRGDSEAFYGLIDLYEQIKPNLDKHAKGFPTAENLRKVVFEGQRTYLGMAGIGEDKDTAGSNHILSLLKDKNNEPIWFLGWGGMNTLMQAIWKIEKMVKDETISEDEKARMLEKIRIFDIAAQDNSCSEIAKTYPDIFYVRSTHQFFSFSKWKYNFNAPEKDSQKGDLSFVNHTWFRDNVQDSKFGDFGKEYPDYRCLYEGDTPSFLYLIQNGLSDPMKPHYGSWAGRFSRNREYSRGAKHNNKYDGDGYVYTDEHESVKDGFEGVNDVYACLWRWREDYQNDFAARMLWTISDSFNKANHNPIVIVNGDETKSVLHVKVQKNRFITLEAGSSYDPDSDTLNYSWWQYKEPGTYRGSVSIEDNTTDTVKVTVPADANSGDTIHIVLTVRDNGDPVLTSYRRVVLTVE